jgi:hypothetical protein
MSDEVDSSQVKPIIFVLNLECDEMWEGLFDRMYSDLIESLAVQYRIQRARTIDAAHRYLGNPLNRPAAILIVDPGLINTASSSVLNLVKVYVRGGGIAVFMASFSSFISPSDMNKFWQEQWGLDWKFGDYHRTIVQLNRYFMTCLEILISNHLNPTKPNLSI